MLQYCVATRKRSLSALSCLKEPCEQAQWSAQIDNALFPILEGKIASLSSLSETVRVRDSNGQGKWQRIIAIAVQHSPHIGLE